MHNFFHVAKYVTRLLRLFDLRHAHLNSEDTPYFQVTYRFVHSVARRYLHSLFPARHSLKHGVTSRDRFDCYYKNRIGSCGTAKSAAVAVNDLEMLGWFVCCFVSVARQPRRRYGIVIAKFETRGVVFEVCSSPAFSRHRTLHRREKNKKIYSLVDSEKISLLT
ncbi:hypothetical protein PUN28_011372 [Cardiocondyla obscurior]|uniref:Uncharacterized protein n=1 Tax=Cardiocondyla obscurior TaxID=286306 RepID=A0AAW2FG26_9HYME